MHLGVALSEVEDGSQRVVLYYTDPGTRIGTQEAASFKMGDLTGRWARFTLTVQGAEVGVMGSVDFTHASWPRGTQKMLVKSHRKRREDCENRMIYSRF